MELALALLNQPPMMVRSSRSSPNKGGLEPFPAKLNLQLDKVAELLWGKLHQRAAYSRESSLPVPSLLRRQLQGKPPVIQYHDASAALEILLEYDEPTAVAVKHTILAELPALRRLRLLSSGPRKGPGLDLGGIVALNRPVDKELAALLTEIFLEVIIACLHPGGLGDLGRKAEFAL